MVEKIRWLPIGVIVLFFIWLSCPYVILAQDEEPTVTPDLTPPVLSEDQTLTIIESADESWSEPLNLSRSGAATSPTIFTGAQQSLHILWLDTFDGMMYMRGNGSTWTTPVHIVLPFETFTPSVYVDSENIGHVLWLDFDDNLFYATVPIIEFVDPSIWSESILIAEGVKNAEIVESEDGFHIVYFQGRDSETNLAGIYIRSMTDELTFALPVAIDTSPYLRLATQDTANLSVATAEESVYVVWDNVGQDQIVLAISADHGETWNTPTIVDQREQGDGPISIPPAGVDVLAQDDRVLIVWYAGHGDVTCGQFFQLSEDRGVTFSARQQIFGDLLDCPSSNRILADGSDDVLMVTRNDEFTYITQRRAGRWRNRVLQPLLMRFTDPITLRDVRLGCLNAVRAGGDLYVIGCDEDVGQDIWLTRQDFVTALTTDDATKFEPILDIEESLLSLTPTIPAEADLVDVTVEQGLKTQDYIVIGSLLLVGVVVAALGVRAYLQQER